MFRPNEVLLIFRRWFLKLRYRGARALRKRDPRPQARTTLPTPPHHAEINMAKRFIPLLDRVLVSRLKPQETISGIIVPEAAQSRLNEGTVVAVGPGARDNKGDIIPMSVKEGDNVLLPEYGGSPVKFDKDEFVIFRNDDLLGILKSK
jgi:chaperonin GroES